MISIKESQFPANPPSSALRKKYVELRDAAQFLSRSRGQYKGQVTRLNTRINEMEVELREFATAAEMTLRQKAELDQLLLKYHDVFEGFELAGDELENAWNNYQGRVWRGNAITELLDAVTTFIKSWLTAKKAKQELEASDESA